ncbi:hypothetical protein [Stutzerimonas stutzeri]|uniref:hypothetical protein n=1 Tax=Stutzerimonas stutzeri TaxID=316 RepID=UPI001F529767|nr:hypothetical protein [Stutzerimonas stutzeri]
MPPHTFMRNCLRRAHAWPGLFGLVLSGCSALGSVGADTFTLEGELPTDFALRAQAHYGGSEGCSGRGHVETFKKEYDKVPHGYQFEIPVSYRDGLCVLQLVRVGLLIYGRYGEKDWQQTYDNGELLIVPKTKNQEYANLPGRPDSINAVCSWLFQESKLNLEISKILNCRGVGARLSKEQLQEQTITLSFTVNPKEQPYRDNTWIEFPGGWKPCLPKEGWQQCQDPPVFKTFRNNDQECTIYPNCTE